MQRTSRLFLVGGVIAVTACFSACKSDDDGGAGTGYAGAAGGGTGGLGGLTGAGAGGAAGTMTSGGIGGVGAGGVGGMAGGMGGAAGTMTGGTGGMTGGAGGMGGMTGGMGGTTGGMGGMTGGMGGMGDAATFTDVYNIIEMKCGGGDFGCHVMGSSGMLEMHDQDQAYMNLVGTASTNCPDETRVVAGDADASLIIKALMGEACGDVDPMPRGRDPLSTEEIATIREWIEAGAMDN